jgi:hypothetical protein
MQLNVRPSAICRVPRGFVEPSDGSVPSGRLPSPGPTPPSGCCGTVAPDSFAESTSNGSPSRDPHPSPARTRSTATENAQRGRLLEATPPVLRGRARGSRVNRYRNWRFLDMIPQDRRVRPPGGGDQPLRQGGTYSGTTRRWRATSRAPIAAGSVAARPPGMSSRRLSRVENRTAARSQPIQPSKHPFTNWPHPGTSSTSSHVHPKP